jgi:thiol-disulfide isomerase/thioredoxin
MRLFQTTLFLLIVLIPLSSIGQKIHTINLDKRLNLDFSPEEGLSTGSNILYELVFPDKIFRKDKGYNIITPKTDKALAYGLAGFRKSTQGIKNYWAYLIADHDTETPLFYFDHNSNFDFSDDGEPVSYEADSLLHFFDGRLKAKFLSINIDGNERILLKFLKDSKSNDMSKGVVIDGNEKVINSNYWPYEIIADLAQGTLTIEQKSYEIQVLDFDENNSFGTRRDFLFTIDKNDGEYKKNYWEYKKGVFVLGEKNFRIKSINDQGTELVIEEDETLTPPKKINIGDSIEGLELETTSNKLLLSDIYENNQYTLLDFWATWCKPCIEAMPELELIKEEYPQFGVIGFACDKKSTTANFETKRPHSWVNVIASDDLQFQFNILGLPNYFLIDSRGKVVAKVKSMASLRDYLEKNIKDQ